MVVDSRLQVAQRPSRNFRTIGGGLAVLVVVALALWNEFYEAGDIAWDAALGVMMLGLIVAAVVGHRYFQAHSAEIGEARFDTRNESDR